METPNEQSLFALLTELSKSIVEEHIPEHALRANKKSLYKKLRSKAYAILLKKVPNIYEQERKVILDDNEFEYFNHPPSELLLLATPRFRKQQTLRQYQLQAATDHLISTGLSEHQSVQDVMEVLINLLDELPADRVPVKRDIFGFINTDSYYAPTKLNHNGAKPYTVFSWETFDPRPLQRTLTRKGESESDSKFRYKIYSADYFKKKRDFGNEISRLIQDRTNSPQSSSQFKFASVASSTQKFQYKMYSADYFKQKHEFGEEISQLVKDRTCSPQSSEVSFASATSSVYISCHTSCQTLNSGPSEDELPSTDQREPTDRLTWPVPAGFWDEAPRCARRTWERPGDWCPPKEKRWLTDVANHERSVVHDLLEQGGFEFCVEDSETLADHLRHLLFGTASSTFTYDQDRETFVLCKGVCVSELSPGAIREACADPIECGSLGRRLNDFSLKPTKESGQMFGTFCAAVQRFLLFYKTAVIRINTKASIMQISMLAGSKLKAQLRCLSGLSRLGSPDPLPRGSQLLTYLYDEVMQISTPGLTHVLLSVLDSCVTLYLRWLEHWLFEGACVAPADEFFVEAKPEFSAVRTRLYWKHAFVVRRADVPGFLRGLERAVLETGKGLDLLRLCNPQHPLLRVMASSRPHMSFVANSSALAPMQAAFEAYYQRALAAVGPPVTLAQMMERSMEAEDALQVRVQQVFEARKAAHLTARREAAAARTAGQAAQMEAWRQQMQHREQVKVRAAERDRKLDEEIARRELVARERDQDMRDSQRKELVSQYEAAFEAIEAKKQHIRDEIAAESQAAATALISVEPSPSEASLSASPDYLSDTKPSPTYQGLPSPNGNSDLLISLLDNRGVADNNRLNLAEDEQNQNAACDNLIVSSNKTEDATMTDLRKASLTLDLRITASAIRKKVLGSDDVLTAPWATNINDPPSSKKPRPKEYRPLQPRNATAEWFTALENRQRVLGSDDALTKPWATNDNDFAASEKPQPTTEFSPEESKRLASQESSAECTVASGNRQRVLGSDDALAKPWMSNNNDLPAANPPQPGKDLSPEEYKRLAALGSRKASAERIRQRMLGISQPPNIRPEIVGKQKPALTAGEIRRKVLETEFGIAVGVTSPETGPPVEVIWQKTGVPANMAADEFDIVTGATKPTRTLSAMTFSKQTQSWQRSRPEVRLDDVPVDTTFMEISPTENAATSKVEYLREESNMSTVSSCGGVTPGMAPVMADSEPDLFVSAKPSFNRLYSYRPCSMFDEQWQQRLASSSGNLMRHLTPMQETTPATDASLVGDLETVNRLLKKMVIIPVRTQMKLVNDAVLKHFLVDLELLSHLQSLRDYYFLLDGEFGHAITFLLFEKLEDGTDPKHLLSPGVLSGILGQALAATIEGENQNSRRLAFALSAVPNKFKHSDPETLSCLNLQYQVEWPLNILVTPEVINKYQQVFSFLLKLRRSSWVMEQLFLSMKQLARDRDLSNSPQFKKTQLIRHVMTHLLHALHNYVTSTVLQESWSELQHDLKEAATLDEIYNAHVFYLKTVLYRCLLGVHGKPEQFQKHLDNIFVLVLKFHGQLTYAGTWALNPRTGRHEHRRFRDVLKIYKLYQEQAGSLVRLSKKLADKGQYSHLFELLQKLSMNDFYEPDSKKASMLETSVAV